jgi:hypothetical protein
MKDALDFAVIGAQKSGTTSLFEYLRVHPRIYIPPDKEVPFFTRDNRYEKGWEWYAGEFFSHAPDDVLWGTVTPQYMADPRVPRRMFQAMQEVKLIALLRNPVGRAFSHHKMAVLRGTESRTFEQAASELLDEKRARRARELPAGIANESACYLVWGEYARILGSYRSMFSEEQVLVLFMEDLEARPWETLVDILNFLGLTEPFTPSNLGRRYHEGATRRRVRSIDKLKKVGILRRSWRLFPEKSRRRFSGRLEKWNTVPEKLVDPVIVDAATVEGLVEYYRPEVERLRELLGREVPWPEFQ